MSKSQNGVQHNVVVLLVLILEGFYYNSVSQGSCIGGKEVVLCQNKVSAFVNFEVDCLNRWFSNFSCILVAVHLPRVLSCIETLVEQVVCLKRLVTTVFKSSELLYLLGLNERVGTIPT